MNYIRNNNDFFSFTVNYNRSVILVDQFKFFNGWRWCLESGSAIGQYNADIVGFCCLFTGLLKECNNFIRTSKKQNCWTSVSVYKIIVDRKIFEKKTNVHSPCYHQSVHSAKVVMHLTAVLRIFLIKHTVINTCRHQACLFIFLLGFLSAYKYVQFILVHTLLVP